MRRTIWRVGVAAVALFMVAPAASADQGRSDGGRPNVVPAVNVAGSGGGALLGDWMGQLLAIPAAGNPLAGKAELCLGLGPNGTVVSPAGGVQDANGNIDMECRVAEGQPVLMVMPTGECSTAEDRPYYAKNERAQQVCAVRALNSLDVTSITLRVDREQPVEIRNDRFLAVSPQGRVVFPEDPVWGRPGPATFAAASWIAEIRGMQRGNHVVVGTTKAIYQGTPISLRFTVRYQVGDRG